MDMLYYLLYSLEQLDIDTEVTPMYLLGDIIRNSEKYLLIYNYIRFIYFLPPQKNNPFLPEYGYNFGTTKLLCLLILFNLD